jgi:hypothetical protein
MLFGKCMIIMMRFVEAMLDVRMILDMNLGAGCGS